MQHDIYHDKQYNDIKQFIPCRVRKKSHVCTNIENMKQWWVDFNSDI